MTELLLSAIGIFILGMTTSLHPCPLTTNIAAISLISGISSGRKGNRKALLAYGTGYVLAFLALALIITFSIVAIPALSQILQRIIAAFLGPILILVGMVLARMLDLNRFYSSISLRKNNRLTNGSFISSMVLGALLALTFCPATASIFFGIMLPLSIKYHKEIIFPVIYGFGALLPVVIISIFITQGSMRYFKNKWTEQLPQVFGWALIVFGIYITLEHLYL